MLIKTISLSSFLLIGYAFLSGKPAAATGAAATGVAATAAADTPAPDTSAAGTAAANSPAADSKTKKPNVIFILTDDMGYGDMGVSGHPYVKTPNIDRLAKEGMLFTQYYANASVCSPSRVALMTGLFPARNNVHHIYNNPKPNRKYGVPTFLDPNNLTVADLMEEAGYTTGHFGKWHLMGNEKGSPAPDQYGFDEYMISHSGGQSPVYKKRFASTDYAINKTSEWIIGDGIDFIKEHEGEGKPFYLQLWTLVPHAPLKPTEEELAAYPDFKASPEDFSSWMRGYAAQANNLTEQMRIYCASITSLDAAIGKLLDYLDQAGLSENTLIFFTSDNGPEDYHVKNATNAGVGSTGVLKGRKRSIYEGGIRMPCIIRWPGHVPSGTVSSTVLSGVDWLPTLAKITGTGLPETYRPDGEDMSDVYLGAQRERRTPLFWEWKFRVAGNQDYLAPQLAVRKGKWKLLCDPDGSSVELYDLEEDREERNNLAGSRPKRVKALRTLLLGWKKTIPETAYPQ